MKLSSKKNEFGTAALYCRLSRDDNMDTESNSIQNQELLCKGWSHHLIHMTAVHLWQNGTLQLQERRWKRKKKAFSATADIFCYK